jgi:hypothetical protein
MMTMDTLRPIANAYGAYPNTQSVKGPAEASSAVGNDSPATRITGRRHWVTVVRSWFRTLSEARWLTPEHRRRHDGLDWDLALYLAARSQHDGIDWDRLVSEAAARSQYDGIDWDYAQDRGASVL